jgi:hypothetical protein
MQIGEFVVERNFTGNPTGIFIFCDFCFGDLVCLRGLHLTRLNVKEFTALDLLAFFHKMQPCHNGAEGQGPKDRLAPLPRAPLP